MNTRNIEHKISGEFTALAVSNKQKLQTIESVQFTAYHYISTKCIYPMAMDRLNLVSARIHKFKE